jgi:hypothetical protein
MKRLIAATLLSTLATAAYAQDKTITGKWTVQVDVAGNAAEFPCNVIQDGKDLKGSCDTLGELKGTAADGTYTWGTTGGQSPLTFTGKLNAEGKLAGTVSVLSYGIDGTFVAAPVK